MGFSKNDTLMFSPEFHQEVAVLFAALHRDYAYIEAIHPSLNYTNWFAEQFPDIWKQWLAQMKSKSLETTHYIPIPIHPWQAENMIPKKFDTLIQSKKLVLFPNIKLITNPTLSFRTVVSKTHPNSPHIKLPVAVQTTSAMRTVSAASTENGPKISKIMRDILQKENYFNGRLRAMSEMIGLHVIGYNHDTTRHLSVIFRENPTEHLQDNECAIVVAALFDHSPLSGIPVFAELLRLSNVNTTKRACQYFRDYADRVLGSYLDLYLLYGIALEGHQQNTLAVFKNGQPTAMIARDFGGLRLHLPSLLNSGFSFSPYPGSATICHNRTDACNKLLHSVYQCHLGEWTLALARYFNAPEDLFWEPVREITEQRFRQLKDKIDHKTWREDYDAILKKDWPLKALLRMRLNNVSHKYIYTTTANPLKA